MQQRHSLLFRYTSQFIKYFILSTLGAVLVCVVAGILGAPDIASVLLDVINFLFFRLALCAFLVLGCAIVFESFR